MTTKFISVDILAVQLRFLIVRHSFVCSSSCNLYLKKKSKYEHTVTGIRRRKHLFLLKCLL